MMWNIRIQRQFCKIQSQRTSSIPTPSPGLSTNLRHMVIGWKRRILVWLHCNVFLFWGASKLGFNLVLELGPFGDGLTALHLLFHRSTCATDDVYNKYNNGFLSIAARVMLLKLAREASIPEECFVVNATR